jgi:DNA mismatch repair ATPase MutL
MTVLGTSKHAHKVSFSQLEEGEQDIAAAVSSMLHEHGGAELEQQQPRPQQQPEQQQQHHHHQHQLQHQQQQQQQLQHHGHQHLSAQPLDGAGTPCNSCCSSTTGASTSNSASGSGGGSSNGSSSAGGGGSSAGGGGSSGDGSGQQGILLKKLLRRAAVSFRDLNISVHDASTASLVHLSDGSGHAQAAASVLPGRQRVNVEQKKLAIIMVRGGWGQVL